MLEKFSGAQVDGLMVKAASALRSLADENANLRAELARRDRHDHAEKIASMAAERGIMEEDDAADYAEQLASGSDDLRLVEDFVNRTAAGVPLGQSREKVASESDDAGGYDVLTAFLLTSDFAG